LVPELKGFYVDPDWHGTGVAATLMGRCISWFTSIGARVLHQRIWVCVFSFQWLHFEQDVFLVTFRDNERARRFYGKHGWHFEGFTEPRVYEDVTCDIVILWRRRDFAPAQFEFAQSKSL
jgi:GNAT superfamily N-acetyltransferase